MCKRPDTPFPYISSTKQINCLIVGSHLIHPLAIPLASRTLFISSSSFAELGFNNRHAPIDLSESPHCMYVEVRKI